MQNISFTIGFQTQVVRRFYDIRTMMSPRHMNEDLANNILEISSRLLNHSYYRTPEGQVFQEKILRIGDIVRDDAKRVFSDTRIRVYGMLTQGHIDKSRSTGVEITDSSMKDNPTLRNIKEGINTEFLQAGFLSEMEVVGLLSTLPLNVLEDLRSYRYVNNTLREIQNIVLEKAIRAKVNAAIFENRFLNSGK